MMVDDGKEVSERVVGVDDVIRRTDLRDVAVFPEYICQLDKAEYTAVIVLIEDDKRPSWMKLASVNRIESFFYLLKIYCT